MKTLVLTLAAMALIASPAIAADPTPACGAQNGVFNWADSPARACRDSSARAPSAPPSATKAARAENTTALLASKNGPATKPSEAKTEFTFSGYAYAGIAIVK